MIIEYGMASLTDIFEFRNFHRDTKRDDSTSRNDSSLGKKNFYHFTFREKKNRIYLVTAAIGAIIQFIIFKLLYPYPDFISDSYSYISTNLYHMDVNLWPIGYSKFLLYIHYITHSDTFLIAVQYLLLEISLAYFFFSFIYLYQPGKKNISILYLFFLFNPIFLYLSNAVLSDSLFATLTIIFLTQFLWMLHRPRVLQLVTQGVIVGLAFTIRYTAIYYPLVVLVGLILSRYRPIVKITGFLLGISLMLPFYFYTVQKTRNATGTPEFSVFGGWQLANNALYMYDHINVDSDKLPVETRALDKLTKQFFQKFNPSWEELSTLPGTYFIKVPYAILKPYMLLKYKFWDPPSQFHAWGMVSPIYNKYGYYLISHHPVAFARWYLLLNTKNYFLPHLEKFKTYNLEEDVIEDPAIKWFDYPTSEVHAVSKYLQGELFYVYPIMFMILNIFFIGHICWFLLKSRFRKLEVFFRNSLIFVSLFLGFNFAFSVFATPVVLRYQVIPMVILLAFTLLLMEKVSKINSQNF